MASPIEAQIILCDAAVADPGGKLHMLGAGWSVTGSPTAPQAVAVLAKIPWDRANQPLAFSLELLNSDGRLVEIGTPGGLQALQQVGTFEVGRPPGVAHGSMLDWVFALTVPPLPLAPGRYEWRLTIAEQQWPTPFEVRGPAVETQPT